jgi:tRNA G10  N-methylase Trm11
MKYINKNFKINDRIYVGPTSADPYLAFLMANQAKVQQN